VAECIRPIFLREDALPMKQLKMKSFKAILPLLILFWGVAAFGLYS
jgi:hypothetical protein